MENRFGNIHEACRNGRLDTIIRLLCRDASLVHLRDSQGQTPLHEAATLEITLLLISYGALVNARDHRGVTPLHRAAERGLLESAKCLVDSGAEVNALSSSSFTPSDYAREHDKHDVADYLEEGL